MKLEKIRDYEISSFLRSVKRGNESNTTIKYTVEKFGLAISPDRSPGTIRAVDTLKDIYFVYGYDLFRRTLAICVKTWGTNHYYNGKLLEGVARFLAAYGSVVDDDLFIWRVGRFSLNTVTRAARMTDISWIGFAEVIHSLYDREEVLPIHRLYCVRDLFLMAHGEERKHG